MVHLTDPQSAVIPAPTQTRISGLVALSQYYQWELFKLADREQTHIGHDDPSLQELSRRLRSDADAIADLCQSDGTLPGDLPVRSRRVYQWLRFLSDPANLAQHLSTLAIISHEFRRRLASAESAPKGRRKRQGATPTLSIEIGPTSMLYQTRTGGGSYRILIHEGYIGAPQQVLDELVQAALGPSVSDDLRKRVRAYGNSDAFAAVQAGLEATTPAAAVQADARGRHHDLAAAFDRVNAAYFAGAMPCPRLTWSGTHTTRKLGQYDASRDCVTVSISLDAPGIPAYVVDYVLYHELLHKALGTERVNGRRRVHTPEFHKAEREFKQYDKAQAFIARMSSRSRQH